MTPADREAIRPKRSSSRGYDYAHMCRDEHVQIGHNDSSSELCPLCREKNRADDAVAEVARLQGLLDRQQEECIWKSDADGVWYTACGDTFVFETYGPIENHQKFCGFCGKLVRAIPPSLQEPDQ